jgi:UDP-N-acetylglucosamine 1-carboxyvinyltransferase
LDKFIIEGGTPLRGEIPISGSKNGALPLMAAALLGDGPSTITNVPKLNDIYTFSNVIRGTGTVVAFDEDQGQMSIDPSHLSLAEAPYELVRKMRASFYMLGALLGRVGHARVSLPGGCAWGPRPVNLHLEGLQALGAEIEMDEGYVIAKAPKGRLTGGHFLMEPSSVGATVNLLLAAVTASGDTVLQNAAIEPDVVTLCHSLARMGAIIDGIGTHTLHIKGVDGLRAATMENAPDRIETGTFMIAAVMHPESEVTLTHTDPTDLGYFTEVFMKTGAELSVQGRNIHIKAPNHIQPISIKTQVYPGFPTDLQAQWATMLTLAQGTASVADTIYTDRFSYVPELVRLGAKMHVEGNLVIIQGPTLLKGASVMSTDLRASVSLVMAAMAAQGKSEVLRVYHLDRGYESLETKLNRVGARIQRSKTEV